MRLVDLRAYALRRGEWMAYQDDAVAKLEEFEGNFAWMYLDTRGVVTVGVGRALFSAEDAVALPFYGADGERLSAADARAAWQRVKGMAPAHEAFAYRWAGCPELESEDIAAMLHSKVMDVDGGLRSSLAGYDRYPLSAKLALIDMAYNLGTSGLLHGFPRLCVACEGGDWKAAAGECHRLGPSEERNDWTEEMFLNAAGPESVN